MTPTDEALISKASKTFFFPLVQLNASDCFFFHLRVKNTCHIHWYKFYTLKVNNLEEERFQHHSLLQHKFSPAVLVKKGRGTPERKGSF